ncbi:hypothetical protein, partial [Brevundimonas sp.]|uniref:hypothetical protein n=1 Tax=Brevundimonas sp. TaxID=1871086 RepID=UPI0035AE9F86
NRADIGTTGDVAHAVFAQSVGGGGGNGGFVFGADFGGSGSKNIGGRIGGFGGPGTQGGEVNVDTSGLIVTEGDGSIGVFAQSIGGGGGTGGSAGGVTLSGSTSVNLELAMGGIGGAGAVGGAVTVSNSGVIDTDGEASHGVFAQSIGGGGGAGGLAGFDENGFTEYTGGGSGTYSFGSNSKNITVNVGGAGGSGNHGGDVSVVNSGQITTRGDQSNVIYAQSVGGGGGDGGVSTSTAAAFGAGQNGAYTVTMGGQGAGGGDGGDVSVVNTGMLAALSSGSNGVFAQSIGGGGGNGGDAGGYALVFSPKAKGTRKAQQVSVTVGGSGGAAGDGGDVDVENHGQIYTAQADSSGVFAQSIGGGGGNGGLVTETGGEIGFYLDQINKGDAKGGAIAIGGEGAGGGHGGDVSVLNAGLIYTQGVRSHGVFAQSIGGGGGNGGSGLAGEISVGGQGGVAGNGGDVSVVNSGVIVTEGFLARGVFAQSIGGGGGNGGATDYSEGEDENGDPYTYREDFSDLLGVKGDIEAAVEFAQSLQQPALGIGVGGSGGSAGDGGDVTVLNTGSIQTSGVLAHGIFAQSVGGGGGTGGEGAIGQLGQVVFSGVGGSGGNGGDVTVTHTGDIVTNGFGAYGIFAQSVGGGGGVAGDVSLGIGDFSLSLGINPFAGPGGDGGDVVVNSTGDIVINAVGGMGIFAQSVGGGGGLYGSGIGLGFIGSFGNDGVAGSVTVNHTGNVVATGQNGIAAVFQSAAKDGVGDITAVLNGHFRGGSVYGRGIFIDGGADNTLTINGSASAVSNLAIEGTTGNDTVINNGLVVGNIDLDGGGGITPFAAPAAAAETNAFVNNLASALVSLDYIDLGGGLLTNHGLIAPGDFGVVQTTEVDGDFLQTGDAVFDLDLDFALSGVSQETDRLTLSGSAVVDGRFDLRPNQISEIKPGEFTATVISAPGGLVDSGVTLNAPTSAVARFALSTTAEALLLNYSVDFSPSDARFNENRTSVGDYVNRIQAAGGADPFDDVVEMLFWIPDNDLLGSVYDSFMPEAYVDNAVAATFAAGRFRDGMFGCPQASGRWRPAGDSCVWVRGAGAELDLDQNFDTYGFGERSLGLQAGAETRLGSSPVTVGAAFSLEEVEGELEDRAWVEGDRRQLGLLMRGDFGAYDTGLTLTAGRASFAVDRGVVTPTGPAVASGTQRFDFQSAAAQVSRTFGDSNLYLRPSVEVSATRYQQSGFSETGAGGLNLVFDEHEETVTRIRPRIELGGRFDVPNAIARPYVSVGVSHVLDGDKPGLETRFEAAGTLADPFTTSQPLDETVWETELGVELLGEGAGISARLGYTGQFGDKLETHQFGVRVSAAF